MNAPVEQGLSSVEHDWDEFAALLAPESARERFVVHVNWIWALPHLRQLAAVCADAALHPRLALLLQRGACHYLIRRYCGYTDKIFVYEQTMFSKEEAQGEGNVYERFLDRCREPRFIGARLEKYGPLRARLDRMGAHFVAFLRDHVAAVGADRDTLERAFAHPFDVDALRAIEFGVGDPHHGAKVGVQYRFATHSLFFKPRPLDTDEFYNRVLALVAPECSQVPTVNRQSHGWQLGISGSAPADRASAARFYRQVGMHLAVLHMLGASDIHYENLVSGPDGDVYVVDTEALFTNTEYEAGLARPETAHQSGFEDAAGLALRRSFFRTGVIPNDKGKAGQWSALNAAAHASGPVKQFVLHKQDDGALKLKQQDSVVAVTACLPVAIIAVTL